MRSDRLRLDAIRRTSAFRLTLSLGTLFLLGTVALIALIYAMTARELIGRSDRILHAEARRLLATPPALLPRRISGEIGRSPSGLSYFALMSASGELIAGNIRLSGMPPADRPIDLPEAPGRHGPLRVLAVRTPPGEVILIARDISQVRDLRAKILAILLASGSAIAIGVAAMATALSRRPLRRVRDLQRAAAEIAAGRMEVRMPIAGVRDELDQFAATVNVMVEEVGHVIAQVKGVTDAIAHDLRTPLARVRARLHRLGREAAVAPGHAAELDGMAADLDLVLERFAALLRISELEASGRRQAIAPTDLARLTRGLFDLFEPLAEVRAITLAIDAAEQITVEADEKLLFEAASNLVDNAIKFSPRGGRVTIGARRDGADAVLEVADQGCGIQPAEKPAVFRRFHRSDAAADVPGSGLGLSVVAAIAHLHGFGVELDDACPGLLARIRMPAAKERPAGTPK